MAIKEIDIHFGAFMKAASPALIALLSSSDQFIMADLYTITFGRGLDFALFRGTERARRERLRFRARPQIRAFEDEDRYWNPGRRAPGPTLSRDHRSDRRDAVFASSMAGPIRRRTPAARARLHAEVRRHQPGNSRPFRGGFRISNAPAPMSISSVARISNC